MSSMLCSQGVVFATAMAVSGTVILLAFRLQKSLPPTQFPIAQIPHSTPRVLRSCISSDRKKRGKKKKRVHFAEDVVEPRGDGKDFRKQPGVVIDIESSSAPKLNKIGVGAKVRGMPANRVALYNGILRDRVVHRLACSY